MRRAPCRWFGGGLITLSMVLLHGHARGSSGPVTADVAIYGATPGGIAAALAAARHGHSVVLVEPTHRIGGLLTCGLSHTDFKSFEALGGTFLDFANRVQAYYNETYGKDAPQAECWRGTSAEPRVNLLVLERMLAEQPTIQVRTRHVLSGVTLGPEAGGRRAIEAITLAAPDGAEPVTIRARVFVDGSYEGDLLAMAGEPYHVGRESRQQYGESLAGDAEGQADGQVQAYNFRLVMTDQPENRVYPEAPAGYRREDFEGVLPLFARGDLKAVFAPKDAIFKLQYPLLPNRKSDINDMSSGLVRLSLPDASDAYPEGDAATRRRIVQQHRDDELGLLYFLQNDPAVPPALREEARVWGLCRDEFADSGHVPPQIYVREGRRLVGQYVYTQGDTEFAPHDARAVLRRDSIAISDYTLNCHGTGRSGTRFAGRHTGEFYKQSAPSQVPYGVIVPTRSTNMLVPVAVSSSHVGFSKLRHEYVWMSLGQAAGHAAHLAIAGALPVQRVDVGAVQDLLHAEGGITVYVPDVPPGSADFAAVQWLGNRGFFHGLFDARTQKLEKSKPLISQYQTAWPHHEAALGQPLTPALESRWRRLAEEGGAPLPAVPLFAGKTRGDMLRAIHAKHGSPSSHE